ncbi:MAG: mevalonate kinase [Terrimesophilobacter sp.]
MTPGNKHHSVGVGPLGMVADSTEGCESMGTGRAHAKVILLGEHAVVYGVPALAVPLPQLTVTARVVRLAGGPTGPDDVSFTTADAAPPISAETAGGLRHLVARFKEVVGVDDQTPLNLLVDCQIPPGRGLGSSAACARAVVLALADLFGRDLDADTVFHLVQEAETAAHGRSSGIDAIVTGSTGIIRYVSGTAEELTCGFDGVFVVADSGLSGRTKDAIDHVRRVFDDDPPTETEFLHRVRELAHAGVAALVDGQSKVFGAKLTENHEVLRGIGISIDPIDALVDTALRAGSLGAKISGGGLGGCLVALTATPTQAQAVAAALRAAGAVGTWFIPVGRFTDGGS